MTEAVMSLKNVGLRYRTRAGLFRHSYYDALSSVSFDLFRGETLGVVGRNGCGKSTLLRILAGIYQPDAGTIERNCRRTCLLALATGFDAELNGMQNAILSSMLLGATRKEAVGKLDEIVEFSELGDFIYKPLKTYSSGMRARLGFAVGVKMNADVLLIDEVMGVGDKAFRNKATQALKQRIGSDQSVVFVSHSASNIKQLCNRALWLEGGEVKVLGSPKEVLAAYDDELSRVKGVGNLGRKGFLRA